MLVLLDLIVIFAFLLALAAVALMGRRPKDAESYLVDSRSAPSWLLAVSTAATQVGMGSIVGLVGLVAVAGPNYALIATVGYALGMVLVAFVAPRIKEFGDANKAYTLGDYVYHRYGLLPARVFSALYFISVLAWNALQFVAIVSALQFVTGAGFELAVVASMALTIAYLYVGGLRADMNTDALQYAVMVVGILVFAAPKSVDVVGLFPAGVFDFGSLGVIGFALGVISLACLTAVGQDVWQRIYASRSPAEARKISVATIALVVPFLFLTIPLGMAVAAIAPGVPANQAIFILLDRTLPPGVLGLALAAVVAAALSTLDTYILALAGMAVNDFEMRFKQISMDGREVYHRARRWVVVFGVLTVVMALLLQTVTTILGAAVNSYVVFAPTLFLGLLWRRANASAVLASLAAGFAVGLYLVFYSSLAELSFVFALLASLVSFIVVGLVTGGQRAPRGAA